MAGATVGAGVGVGVATGCAAPSVPITESAGELSRLLDVGKAKAIGVSNVSLAQLEAAEQRRQALAAERCGHQRDQHRVAVEDGHDQADGHRPEGEEEHEVHETEGDAGEALEAHLASLREAEVRETQDQGGEHAVIP